MPSHCACTLVACLQALHTSLETRVDDKLSRRSGDDPTSSEETKGFTHKNVPKPKEIDIHGRDSQEFHAWHDLFIVNLATNDAKWELILKAAEEFDKETIDDAAIDKIKTKLTLTDEGMRKVQQYLYLNLLQYTKGDSHSRVVAGGMENSLDVYRQLITKGKMAQL